MASRSAAVSVVTPGTDPAAATVQSARVLISEPVRVICAAPESAKDARTGDAVAPMATVPVALALSASRVLTTVPVPGHAASSPVADRVAGASALDSAADRARAALALALRVFSVAVTMPLPCAWSEPAALSVAASRVLMAAALIASAEVDDAVTGARVRMDAADSARVAVADPDRVAKVAVTVPVWLVVNAADSLTDESLLPSDQTNATL